MKKLAFTALVILSCGVAHALPLGNPAEASLMTNGVFCEGWQSGPCDPCVAWYDMWSVRFGFYGDYVFNRHMEGLNHGGDIRVFEMYTNAGYMVLNLCNRLDLFATLGATQIDALTPAKGLNQEFNFIAKLNFMTDFSWSVGGRGTLWQCGCLAFGIEGQYFRTYPEFDYFQSQGNAPAYFDGFHFRYSEWQVGLGAAYRISIGACAATALVPYAGAIWNRARFDLNNFAIPPGAEEPFVVLPNLRNRRDWGWALGVSLLGCEKALISVEGRFINEKALYVNGQIRF